MNEEKQEIIQESMEIAKTIKSQINKTVLMCAAARNFYRTRGRHDDRPAPPARPPRHEAAAHFSGESTE